MPTPKMTKGRESRKHAGSLRPLLGILTAVLAVQIYQNGGLPIPDNLTVQALPDNPAFVTGVLTLGGIPQPNLSNSEEYGPAGSGVGTSGVETSGFSLSRLFSLQSPAFAQAGARTLTEEPTETPMLSVLPSSTPEPTHEPQTRTPSPTDPEPTQDAGPVEISDTAPSPSERFPDVNPSVAWIGGPYSPPPSDDPSAKRLIEVTLLPSTSSTYDSNGLVYVKNTVTDPLDLSKIMAQDIRLKPSQNDAPQILIVHTHGSESYFPDERDYYVPTDIQRTEDTQFNVVRVGAQIAEGLRAYGLNVLHDQTICDSPSYTGAYSKSLSVIQQRIKEYPSIQMVIDVHRDSMVSDNGTAYKIVSHTDKGKAAQLMFVVGSNIGGLNHPNWKDNLNTVCQIQQRVLEQYPTLMRPMSFRKERFNQHATPGSCLLEVGTAWNTLQEALLAADLFCETAGPLLAEHLNAAPQDAQ